jgi:hypothetical protein
MNYDELEVTLKMLDYDYLIALNEICIFLKSKNIDPVLKELLNNNKYDWVQIKLYNNNCAIHIYI